MDDRIYQLLKVTAIVLTLAWVGWSIYDSFVEDRTPGELSYHSANKLLKMAPMTVLCGSTTMRYVSTRAIFTPCAVAHAASCS